MRSRLAYYTVLILGLCLLFAPACGGDDSSPSKSLTVVTHDSFAISENLLKVSSFYVKAPSKTEAH